MRYLVAFDGTPNASHCLDYLCNTELSEQDEIKVVAVWDHHAFSIIPERLSEIDAQNLVTNALNRLSEKCRQKLSGNCLKGNVSSKILELSEEWKADTILLGTHARTELPESLIGNIACEVLHGSRNNVMLLRPSAYKQDPSSQLRSLICIDQKELAEKLLEQNNDVVFPRNSRLGLLHVHSENCWKQEHFSQTQELLEKMQDQVSKIRSDLEPEILIVENSDASAGILKVAREWQSDFIVMSTPAYPPLEREAIGSVSEQVAQKALCSVQIVRVKGL